MTWVQESQTWIRRVVVLVIHLFCSTVLSTQVQVPLIWLSPIQYIKFPCLLRKSWKTEHGWTSCTSEIRPRARKRGQTYLNLWAFDHSQRSSFGDAVVLALAPVHPVGRQEVTGPTKRRPVVGALRALWKERGATAEHLNNPKVQFQITFFSSPCFHPVILKKNVTFTLNLKI